MASDFNKPNRTCANHYNSDNIDTASGVSATNEDLTRESDKVTPRGTFDVLLGEAIGELTPPDLSQAILGRVRQNPVDQSVVLVAETFDSDEHLAAAVKAESDLIESNQSSDSRAASGDVSPSSLGESASSKIRRHKSEYQSSERVKLNQVRRNSPRLFVGWAVVAAVLLLLVAEGLMSVFHTDSSKLDEGNLAAHTSDAANGSTSENRDRNSSSIDDASLPPDGTLRFDGANSSNRLLAQQSDIGATNPGIAAGPSDMSLESDAADRESPNVFDETTFSELKPTRDDVNNVAHSNASSIPEHVSNSSALALKPAAIVSVIDEQFLQLWSSRGIDVEIKRDNERWLSRVTAAVLQREPTAEEWRLLRESNLEFDRIQFVRTLATSDQFVEVWTNRLAQNWFGDSFGTYDGIPKQQYLGWLKSQLQARKPIVEIQRSMVSARGTDVASGENYRPELHWLVRNQIHRQNNGERVSYQMLGLNLSCVQCHLKDAHNRLTTVEQFNGEDYWGMVAASENSKYHHISLEGPSYLVTDLPAREFVFRHPNGSSAKALPKFIGAELGDFRDASDYTVASFTSDMINSEYRRREFVNLVWRELLGRDLVPPFGLAETEGSQERIELRDFLAAQFKSNDEQLGRLIVSIAATSLFDMPGSTSYERNYVIANDDELRKWKTATLTFAEFDDFRPLINAYVGDKLEQFAMLLEQRPEAIRSRDQLLTSPNFGGGIQKKGSRLQSRISELQRELSILTNRHVASARVLPAQLEEQVTRWINSQMSWEQMLQHALFLSFSDMPMDQFTEISNRILIESDQDMSVAIRRVLYAMVAPLSFN